MLGTSLHKALHPLPSALSKTKSAGSETDASRHWELLHAFVGTGMWECVDFYPVPMHGRRGLETHTTAAPAVKYVLKTSLDEGDNRHRADYYALGSYNTTNRTFRADDPARDTGIGLHYDSGKLFAYKT